MNGQKQTLIMLLNLCVLTAAAGLMPPPAAPVSLVECAQC